MAETSGFSRWGADEDRPRGWLNTERVKRRWCVYRDEGAQVEEIAEFCGEELQEGVVSSDGVWVDQG